ncbi:MAG: DNA polymerase III subunit chi [Betaproteobacteria bacterium]|nr:MAG: DNA polymerase III subunit chi [Betaproteobacteria bacterium]
MTEINFYTGVANPLNAAAKLVAKAYASGKRVRVVTPDAAATQALDQMLWEQPTDDFLPHVALDSEHAALTPIIVDHAPTHDGGADVLINLAMDSPPFFARFERVFEIVGRDDAVAKAGRERWTFYKARGYAMTHTVMNQG